MPSAPRNPQNARRRDFTRIGVFVSPDGETLPTLSDFAPEYKCTGVTQQAGGSLWEAEFTVNLARLGRRIGNEKITANMNRLVEVWTLADKIPPDHPDDEEFDPRVSLLFRGELRDSDATLQAAGGTLEENPTLKARVPEDWFDELILGQEVYSPFADAGRKADVDLEFNPEIDGRILPNMVAADDGRNPYSYPIFVDPESVRTQVAVDQFHGEPELWTLKDAVKNLCGAGNVGQVFIRNPSDEHTDTFMEDAPPLVNVKMGRGGWLPQYLDDLLPRHGRNWFLVAEKQDDPPETQLRIAFYERGRGRLQSVLLQPFNSRFDPAQTNIDGLQVTYDINPVHNVLMAMGALKEREVTRELYRTWLVPDDGNLNDLDNRDPIMRKWGANEGGDYCGNREEIPDDPPDIFGDGSVPKRRTIKDTLQWVDVGGQMERAPPLVEFSTDNGSTWADLRTLHTPFRILQGEIGIQLTAVAEDGESIPEELMELDPEHLRLRITGTVRSDKRMSYVTSERGDTPQSRTVTKYLDLSDRYYDIQRQTTGDSASVLTGDADERDDSEEMEEFVDSLLPNVTGANVRANVRLPGIITSFRIGDVLTQVRGRGISLARQPEGAENMSYLQIVGIQFQLEGEQFTFLRAEPYDAVKSLKIHGANV